MAIVVACPDCGSSEDLATTEKIDGLTGCAITIGEDGELSVEHEGYTVMNWDSSVTTGYYCRYCEKPFTDQELITAALGPVSAPQPSRRGSLSETLARQIAQPASSPKSARNRKDTELFAEIVSPEE